MAVSNVLDLYLTLTIMQAEIDWEVCRGCTPCLARKVCRTRAIVQMETGEPVFIEIERCNGCNKCVPACPYAAIRLNKPYVQSSHSDSTSNQTLR